MRKANTIPAHSLFLNSFKAIMRTLHAKPTCTRNYQLRWNAKENMTTDVTTNET